MIHYYDYVGFKKDSNQKTYCGLSVDKLQYSLELTDDADHLVLPADLWDDDRHMCPECSKHPRIQMEILKLVEI